MLRNRSGGTTSTSFTAAYGSSDFSYGNGSAKSPTYTSPNNYGNTTGGKSSYGKSSGNTYGSGGTISYGSHSVSTKNDSHVMKKKNKVQGGNFTPIKLLPWILTLLFFVTTIFCRSQTNSAQTRYSQMKADFDSERKSLKQLKRDHNQLDNDYDKKHQLTSQLEIKASELEREVQQLNGRLREKEDALLQSKNNQGSSVSSSKLNSEISGLKRRDEALRNRISSLVEKIELESYREAVERFGPGPHRVQMEVQMEDRSYAQFTIQMHDLDKMPHSVNLFLQQVYHGLWDETSFVINAPHILQAGTLPVSGSGKTYDEKMEEFEKMGLSQVSFQEYHRDYSHKEWTVGFAGRPGGPDFYINKMDNSKNHGPGGQKHHDLKEEADPCFGYISEGKDTLHKVFGLNTGAMEHSFILDKPVHIHRAIILDLGSKKTDTSSHGLKDLHFDFDEEYEDFPEVEKSAI